MARLAGGDAASAISDLEVALRGVEELAGTLPELAELGPLYGAKLEEARRVAGPR